MIKIIIADDHFLIREGIKKLLQKEHDIEIAAESEDPFELPELVKNTNCDVLLLDINMPGRDGLEVLKDINSQNSRTKVLILSMYPEEQFARRAFKAGAHGYITKKSAPAELIKAIRKIADGRRYVSESFAEELTLDLDGSSEKAPHELLSDREFQVLKLMASGKTITEISENLNLGISTISTYRSRIMEKLDVSSNVDLIRYALQHKINE